MNFIPERIELPVFPKSTKVHVRDEYIDVAKDPDRSYFVRGLFLGYNPLEKFGLLKILRIAEAERQHIGELCGASVIDAKVALYNIQSEDTTPPTTDNTGKHIPKGYRLVAEVPVIRGFHAFSTDSPPDERKTDAKAYTQARQGLETYHKNIGEGECYLSDMSITQLGLDANRNSWLVDPDPIVKQK